MKNILMPTIGESVKEGTVINVLVKPGDTIENGQTLLEVETDKVTFDVSAEESGEIIEIFVQKGNTIHPGDLLIKLNAEIAEVEERIDNNILEEVNSDLSPKSVAQQHLIDKYLQDQPLQYPDLSDGLLVKETKKIISTPLARKLARELGIEITEIGKSINKRISVHDVKIFAKNRIRKSNNEKEQISLNKIPALPDFEKFGSVHRKDMSAIMNATSRNMMISASNIPHAWLQEKVDITDLETKRKKHKSQVEKAGGNLTITALVVKAVAHALQAFPLVNSSLDIEKNQIIIKDHFHIGVAVDTDRGLLVPVIRDVEKQSLTTIAVELTRISKEAKLGKTKLEDLEGATFTISNLGSIGVTSINPMVNWPQVAILALSSSQIEPVWIENQFTPRLRIPITLGFDHRVLNGADAARFLQYLKNLLEEPFLLLL